MGKKKNKSNQPEKKNDQAENKPGPTGDSAPGPSVSIPATKPSVGPGGDNVQKKKDQPPVQQQPQSQKQPKDSQSHQQKPPHQTGGASKKKEQRGTESEGQQKSQQPKTSGQQQPSQQSGGAWAGEQQHSGGAWTGGQQHPGGAWTGGQQHPGGARSGGQQQQRQEQGGQKRTESGQNKSQQPKTSGQPQQKQSQQPGGAWAGGQQQQQRQQQGGQKRNESEQNKSQQPRASGQQQQSQQPGGAWASGPQQQPGGAWASGPQQQPGGAWASGPQQQSGGAWASGPQQQPRGAWASGPQQQQPGGAWGSPQQQGLPKQGQPKGPKPQQQQQQQAPSRSPSISSTSSQPSDISQLSLQSSPSQKSLTILPDSPRPVVSLRRGTRGRKIVIETNYMDLILDGMKDLAYQYDIKFNPDKPKRFLRSAFQEYCRNVKIPPGALAFDGKANVYSPTKLKPCFLTTIEVDAVFENDSKKMEVTLMETADSEIEMSSLRNYHQNRIFDKPMRALQCLDVVLNAPCHSKGIHQGRAFFNPPKQRIDLFDNYELWLGLFQAATLGERPFLNIDISHRAFISPGEVIKAAKALSRDFDERREMDFRTVRTLDEYLRGLVIIYTPPRSFGSQPKRYKYNTIKGPSNTEQFNLEGSGKITVSKYFEQRGYNLRYPHLPCIHVGNPDKTNFIPIELLHLPAQVNLKKAGPRQVQNMIRYAATSTGVRKDKILDQFDRMQHNKDPTLNSFGVKVGTNFISVEARVLNAPAIEYAQSNKVMPRNGNWNCGPYIEGAAIYEWAVLVKDGYVNEKDAYDFARKIRDTGKRCNMTISEKFSVLKNTDDRTLRDELRKFKNEKKNLVFVIMSGRNQNSYKSIKQSAEMELGLLTQCIKSDTIIKRLSPATVQNILLKVNAKLNGFNHKILEKDSTKIMQKQNVMFVGADVTHPTPDQKSMPSIVGVAASHDLNGFKYNMHWCLQPPTNEIIAHMEDITLKKLHFFEKQTGKLPDNIIYFRDGVSDGQFKYITNIELRAMDRAFAKKKRDYRPKLTCLIVQKRHHTRFFPKKGDGIGKFDNVPPGTCVDTVITHPAEQQFFLVSHESIQGTAKPTKYCLIRDDANFEIDDLQELTYNMCHMFTRCNRAVSYPAPAYYAHHIALRGKIYIDGQKLNMNNLERETSNRAVKDEIINGHPMYFV